MWPCAVEPGRSPGVVQPQQRQQAERLRLARERPRDDAGQPDRVVGKITTARVGTAGGEVGLVVREVDHGEDGVQALGHLVDAGHPYGDAGLDDLALGPHDPLRDRRLRA